MNKFYIAGYDADTRRHFAEIIEAESFDEAREILRTIGRQRFGGREPQPRSVTECLPTSEPRWRATAASPQAWAADEWSDERQADYLCRLRAGGGTREGEWERAFAWEHGQRIEAAKQGAAA